MLYAALEMLHMDQFVQEDGSLPPSYYRIRDGFADCDLLMFDEEDLSPVRELITVFIEAGKDFVSHKENFALDPPVLYFNGYLPTETAKSSRKKKKNKLKRNKEFMFLWKQYNTPEGQKAEAEMPFSKEQVYQYFYLGKLCPLRKKNFVEYSDHKCPWADQ